MSAGWGVPDARVRVGWVETDGWSDADVSRLGQLVGSVVLAAAGRQRRPRAGRERIAAHALARRMIERVASVPAGALILSRRCRGCGSPDHGKPTFHAPDGTIPAEVSLAHSAGLVAVALAGSPVGIDVEAGDALIEWRAVEPLLRHRDEPVLTAGAQGVRAWTRKEAALKATGEGLTASMTTVRVQAEPAGHWTATTAQGSLRGIDLTGLPATGAVALLGAGPTVEVRVERVDPR